MQDVKRDAYKNVKAVRKGLTMIDRATLTTYLLSIFTMLTGLSLGEWLWIGSFLLGVFTFCINWYYKHQDFVIKKQTLINKDNPRGEQPNY